MTVAIQRKCLSSSTISFVCFPIQPRPRPAACGALGVAEASSWLPFNRAPIRRLRSTETHAGERLDPALALHSWTRREQIGDLLGSQAGVRHSDAGVVALDQALRLKTFQSRVRCRPLRRRRLGDRRRSQPGRRSQKLEDCFLDLRRPKRLRMARPRPLRARAPGRAGVGFTLGPPAPFSNSRLMASRVVSSSLDSRTNTLRKLHQIPAHNRLSLPWNSPLQSVQPADVGGDRGQFGDAQRQRPLTAPVARFTSANFGHTRRPSYSLHDGAAATVALHS